MSRRGKIQGENREGREERMRLGRNEGGKEGGREEERGGKEREKGGGRTVKWKAVNYWYDDSSASATSVLPYV